MIDINLLPHREARRVADLRESLALLGLGLVLIVGGVYFANRSVNQEIARATSSVRQLEADIERYRPEEEKVKTFGAQRDELEDKLAVIDSLDRARSGPVRMMDELARTIPERLWLKELNTSRGKITLRGESIDTGVVADFLRALNTSKYFNNVDLDRTAGGSMVQGVRLVSFVITAAFSLPSDDEEEKG